MQWQFRIVNLTEHLICTYRCLQLPLQSINDYRHLDYEFESHSWRGVLDTTLCHKVCQSIVAGWRFSLGTPILSTNKTDCHNMTKILLKVALNTITLTL